MYHVYSWSRISFPYGFIFQCILHYRVAKLSGVGNLPLTSLNIFLATTKFEPFNLC